MDRIAPDIHDQIIEMALKQSELSPRELAVRLAAKARRNRCAVAAWPPGMSGVNCLMVTIRSGGLAISRHVTGWVSFSIDIR